MRRWRQRKRISLLCSRHRLLRLQSGLIALKAATSLKRHHPQEKVRCDLHRVCACPEARAGSQGHRRRGLTLEQVPELRAGAFGLSSLDLCNTVCQQQQSQRFVLVAVTVSAARGRESGVACRWPHDRTHLYAHALWPRTLRATAHRDPTLLPPWARRSWSVAWPSALKLSLSLRKASCDR